MATPGHAAAHHAYLVTDHARVDEPWFVLTGDALLVGDVGRPDLHAHGEQTVEEMARTLYRSLTGRLLSLPDDLLLYPAHYAGSVCGRGLSGHPASTIGFERRHNQALQAESEEAFVAGAGERHPAGARAPGRDRRCEPGGQGAGPHLAWRRSASAFGRTCPSSPCSSASTPWSGRWSA